jgi:predicted negative regulator of RcsB-dependent stress response
LTDYLTEQEQIEMLKNWIKQYSFVILASVVFTILVISGWRYWQDRQNKNLVHASAVYDEMLTLRARSDSAGAAVQAQKLLSHYGKTTYGQMAALMLAREAAIKKNFPETEKYLRSVLKNSDVASLKQIARIRLARTLITEQKSQDAITLLNTVDDKNFNGLTDEVKGDAYYALKNTAMARQSYKQALTELPNAEIIRPLLQMKYDNLIN